MAMKVSLIVIWPSFQKTKWPSYLMFNVKSDYPIEKVLYLSYRKSWPETLFQLLIFTFDPFFNVKWGYLTTKTLYLL